MMEAIFCCKCGDMPKFSADAYQLLFPKTHTPEIWAGSDEIYKLYSDSKGEMAEYLRPFVKSKGKFSYYIEYDTFGHIINLYDLKTGRRVA